MNPQKESPVIFVLFKNSCTFASQSQMIGTTSRSGAVVARWAHNPKVVSSSLASATKKSIQ